MNRRQMFALLATAGLIAMVTGAALNARLWAASTQEAALPAADVKIDNFSFGPASLTVVVGTTVTWTNRDDMPHSVVSTNKIFKSPVLDTDEKFSYTFTTPGTYAYFCGLHPKMTGKVVVEQPKSNHDALRR
jgi:amicyanin